MSIQSLITPAMFIVKAEVLPIRRKTAWGGKTREGGSPRSLTKREKTPL
jgi:hypothetical protein